MCSATPGGGNCNRPRDHGPKPYGRVLEVAGVVSSKYPPAEPGALEMGPLEAAVGVADVIRHEVTLFDPAFLLQRQLGIPEVLPQFSVEHLSAVLGNEHHVVFALPLGGA